jgi:hypothetical protein
MNHRLSPLVLLASGALALGACGSSDDNAKTNAGSPPTAGASQTAATKELSKDDLVKEAGKICDAFNKEANKLQPPSSPDKATEFIGQLKELADDEASKLEALTAPTEVATDYKAMIATQRELITLLTNVAGKVEKKDLTALQSMSTELPKLGQKFSAAAKRVGVEQCANG